MNKQNDLIDAAPLLQSRFEVEFAGPTFTENDKLILKSSVTEMRGTDIEMDLSIIKNKVQPLTLILDKLKQNPDIGDINILMLDEDGKVVGTKTYTHCQAYVSEFADCLTYKDTGRATMRLSITKYKAKTYDGTEIPS